MTVSAFYEEMRAIRFERVLDASVAIIAEQGWDRLSMTEVARRSGVPRQSLYKEIGTKSELGKAVVQREVERFLGGVCDEIAAHTGDVVEGLGAVARFALEYGETNAVLQAILRTGDDPKLLKLLTVRPEAVLTRVTSAVARALGPVVSDIVVDTTVRLALSHLLQPTVGTDDAVDRIKHTVQGLLVVSN